MSVCGTVPRRRALGIISRRHESADFALQSPTKLPFSTQLSTRISLRASSPRALDRVYQRPAQPLLTRHPISISSRRYWTMNQFPIDYAFQPRLRGRLTLGRLPLPRKPRAFGERVSHPSLRYSCRHTPFCPLQGPSRIPLHQVPECSPTACDRSLQHTPATSVPGFSPVGSSAHHYSTSELLRTLSRNGCF